MLACPLETYWFKTEISIIYIKHEKSAYSGAKEGVIVEDIVYKKYTQIKKKKKKYYFNRPFKLLSDVF